MGMLSYAYVMLFISVICSIGILSNFFSLHFIFQNSGSRMKTAGRFKPCVHMGCFDLDTFVELNQRSRKVRICACRCTSEFICAGLFEHLF